MAQAVDLVVQCAVIIIHEVVVANETISSPEVHAMAASNAAREVVLIVGSEVTQATIATRETTALTRVARHLLLRLLDAI